MADFQDHPECEDSLRGNVADAVERLRFEGEATGVRIIGISADMLEHYLAEVRSILFSSQLSTNEFSVQKYCDSSIMITRAKDAPRPQLSYCERAYGFYNRRD